MRLLSKFVRSCQANAVLTFTAALPLILAVSAGAVDYTNLARARVELQSVADGSALSGAKELRLAGMRDETVVAVAENYVRGALPSVDVGFSGTVSTDRNHLEVRLSRTLTFLLPHSLSPMEATVTADAEAQAYGGQPTCLMGLDPADSETVAIDRASITAPSCAVYANSKDSSALKVKGSGSVKAALVCSSGGADISGGTLSPSPKLDCPQSGDPLADRPEPRYGACDFTDFKTSGAVILTPGVYCGGIELASGAVAALMAGIYVIKDGSLKVANNAVMTGTDVGFFFSGDGSSFDIAPTTTVKLTAPMTGPMAGILFFESRANAATSFKILSRDAPLLLGTFYMPKSTLEVGAPGSLGLQRSDVGKLAAWTIIVARKVSVGDGLNLVLNTDYAATRVPVPEGLGGSVALVR